MSQDRHDDKVGDEEPGIGRLAYTATSGDLILGLEAAKMAGLSEYECNILDAAVNVLRGATHRILVERLQQNLAESADDLAAKLKPYEDGERASPSAGGECLPGWKLVPIKATVAMVEAARNTSTRDGIQYYADTYEAMLSAAPVASSAREPIRRWITEAVWYLGLTETIKPVTPYSSSGEMIEHVITKARDLERTANLRVPDSRATDTTKEKP